MLRSIKSKKTPVAVKQFVAISLADTVRTWWRHPRIATLLRYGFEYVRTDLQKDVQDGEMWAEFIATATENDLAWNFVCDPMEVNGRHSRQCSVTPCKQ